MKQIPNDLFFAWVETEIADRRSVCFRLKGNSMYPLLRNGRDEVLLAPFSADELQPMDVVLFRYKGAHLLHRIQRIEGDRLYIQGDGTFVAKEECNRADVVGKVTHVIRPSGKRIPVNSWRWKLPSYCWVHLGILRKPLLRILHVIFLR